MRIFRRLLMMAIAGALIAPVAALAQSDGVDEIAAEFGGVYDDPELARYVESVGRLIAASSDAPDKIRSFTILDSDIVNAFSVPSGEVFVSRGLLALANSEAELASVLGHEIGHVTAGHGAQRQTRGVLGQLGAGLLGAVLGSPDIGNLAGMGAQLYLRRYSRDQEFEADTLGIRFMGRAGFDQRQSAGFLRSLEASSALEGKLAGGAGGDAAYSILADHPRTLDRVERATEAAGAHPPPADAMVERDIYLQKIDGLLYGPDPAQGVVRQRMFIHPGMRFAFEVPSGFQIKNGARQVVAQGPGGAVIVFDRAPRPFRGSAEAYLTQGWETKMPLERVEPFTVDGMEAATGTGRAQLESGGTVDVRFVAIRFDADLFFRFLFISPPNATPQLSGHFQSTAKSFRRLTEKEADAVRPLRIRIETVRASDTVDGFARRLPFDDLQRERFLVLNGLFSDATLRPGDKVKTIVESGRR